MNYAEQLPLIMAGFVTTFVLFFGAEVYAKMLIKDVRDKGVFVQGVFRSNMAIISLSVATNAYGAVGTSVGAVYMGVLTILYNILSSLRYHARARVRDYPPKVGTSSSKFFKIRSSLPWCLPLSIKAWACLYHPHRLPKQVSYCQTLPCHLP